MGVRENVERVRERIVAACKRVGRSAGDVQLMAVSKTHPAAMVREAYDAGVTVFGENRVQEFAAKSPFIAELRIEWHLIGHLQSNKAKKAAELFEWVDSIDSLATATRLERAAAALGRELNILLEVNIGGEPAKNGFTDEKEIRKFLRAADGFEALYVKGLMCIPPQSEDPEQARPYFRQLREMRDLLRGYESARVQMDELSMGMSHDFEIAIEEGSTCVRIGSALFGERAAR